MFSRTDIKDFQDILSPMVERGAIHHEIYQLALASARDVIAGSGSNVRETQDKFITRNEAAELLACSTRQIDRLCKEGRLHKKKISKRATKLLLSEVNSLLA